MFLAVRRAGCALISMLAVLAIAAPRRHGRSRGEGRRCELAGERREADQVPGRPVQGRPGSELDRLRASHERPQVDGYITRIQPDLTYLDGTVPGVDVIHLHHAVWVNTSRRRDRPVASPSASSPRARRRRSCTAQGLRLPAQAHGRPAAQPHDPQPHARADPGLHGLADRLHPRQLARRPAGSARCDRSGWTSENGNFYPVFNVREGHGREGQVHVPRRRPQPVPRRAQEERVGRGPAGRARRARPATCIPAGSTPTCTRRRGRAVSRPRPTRRAARQQGSPVPSSRSTSSPPGRCRGTSR